MEFSTPTNFSNNCMNAMLAIIGKYLADLKEKDAN